MSRSGTTVAHGSTLDSQAVPITYSGSSSYVFAGKYTGNIKLTAKSEVRIYIDRRKPPGSLVEMETFILIPDRVY